MQEIVTRLQWCVEDGWGDKEEIFREFGKSNFSGRQEANPKVE